MSFHREKHVRYWRMCAKILPDHYISNDSSRMTLGFFIVSALDLLGALEDISEQERQSWISWIYDCQILEGGFRGFTGTNLGEARTTNNSHWDPANVPATFFALATLLVLGDDLSHVRRKQCLEWLRGLQRPDGSFGEFLSECGRIEGEPDLRQCSCAAGIAFILQSRKDVNQKPFDQEKLISYIQSCQNHDGGFGESPMREPQSGLSYCAVEALSFIQQLNGRPSEGTGDLILASNGCTRWFLERQTTSIDEDPAEDDEKECDHVIHSNEHKVGDGSKSFPEFQIAGFNGRDNKIADTCYSFWNTGALAILEQQHLVDADAMKAYLLEVTQHHIGGFGKARGDPPDVLHSYLGLATLGLFGQSGVKALNPTLCVSVNAAARLDLLDWKRLDEEQL